MMPLSATEINGLLQAAAKPGVIVRRTPTGFDRAALFLLDYNYENLFEAAVSNELDKMTYRCKGCLSLIKRIDRKLHYDTHKRESSFDA